MSGARGTAGQGAGAGFRPAGANGGRSRSHNRRLVLGRVRASGPVGRAQIARGTGLSVQAVSNIIAELEADGLLVEAGRRVAGRGLPAMQYALNASGGHALGAEVRPDALLVALIDLEGRARFVRREPLAGIASAGEADAAPDAVAARLAALRDEALLACPAARDTLLGAGVVMPGPFVETGLDGAASALARWHGVDARALFADALGLDVLIENDANAAAVGERVAGVARGLDGYAYLYFGAGLGLGIVHEGRLFRGASGSAGEIGHALVPRPGGGAGGGHGDPVALEDVASRLALRRRLAAAGRPVDTVDDIDARHRARDPALLGWLDEAAPALAHAIGTLENLLDPATTILGGALPDALLDELIGRIEPPARSVANRADRAVPRLLRGASGRMTATLGGAALVVNRACTPQLAALG